MKKYYRVCNINTHQGLWYDYQGIFTGLIHNKFNFCLNTELKMDFDPDTDWKLIYEYLKSKHNVDIIE